MCGHFITPVRAQVRLGQDVLEVEEDIEWQVDHTKMFEIEGEVSD